MPKAARARKAPAVREPLEAEPSSENQIEISPEEAPKTNARGKKTAKPKNTKNTINATNDNESGEGDEPGPAPALKPTGRTRKAAAVPEEPVILKAEKTKIVRGRGKKAVIVELTEESEEIPSETEKPVTAKINKGGPKKAVAEVDAAGPTKVEPTTTAAKAKGRTAKPKAQAVKKLPQEPKKTKAGRGKKAVASADEEEPAEVLAPEEVPQNKKKRGGRDKKSVAVLEADPNLEQETEDSPQKTTRKIARGKKWEVVVELEENLQDLVPESPAEPENQAEKEEAADDEELVTTPAADKKKRGKGKKTAVAKVVSQQDGPFADSVDFPIDGALSNIEIRKTRGTSAPTTPTVTQPRTVIQTPTEAKNRRQNNALTSSNDVEEKIEEDRPPKKRAAAKKHAAPAQEEDLEKEAPTANKRRGRAKVAVVKETSDDEEEGYAPPVRKDRKRKDRADPDAQAAKKSMKQK